MDMPIQNNGPERFRLEVGWNISQRKRRQVRVPMLTDAKKGVRVV